MKKVDSPAGEIPMYAPNEGWYEMRREGKGRGSGRSSDAIL
jgi:hypothetical protein